MILEEEYPTLDIRESIFTATAEPKLELLKILEDFSNTSKKNNIKKENIQIEPPINYMTNRFHFLFSLIGITILSLAISITMVFIVFIIFSIN